MGNFVSLPDLRTELTLAALKDLDKERATEFDLVSIAAYGPPLAPLYAAIWWPAEAPLVRHIEEQYDPSTPWTPESFGLRPRLVTATGDLRHQGQTGVSTTWVSDDVGIAGMPTFPLVRVTRTLAALWGKDAQKRTTQSRSCESFDVVAFTADNAGERETRTRFLGCFGQNPTATFGMFSTGWVKDQPNGLRTAEAMRIARLGFKRCSQAVPTGTGHRGLRNVYAVMQGDTYAPWPADLNEDFLGGTLTDGPIRTGQVNDLVVQRAGEGLFPLHVGANGIGKNARLCITFVPKRAPKTRYFRLVSGTDPSDNQHVVATPSSVYMPPWAQPAAPFNTATTAKLQSLKGWAENMMRGSNIPSAQIAIAVDGRLKLLWSLTLGELGWPMTQPMSKFRVASCSKFLTAMRAVSVGIMPSGKHFLDTSIPDALGLSADEIVGAPVVGNRFQNATVKDFLRMVGGINQPDFTLQSWRHGGRSLPMTLGLFRESIKNGWDSSAGFMKYEPRTYEEYDNVAFSVVGEALGQQLLGNSSTPYLDVMFDETFWPGNLESHINVIQPTRQECIDFGEMPARSDVVLGTNTRLVLSKLSSEDLESIPDGYVELRPGGYHDNPDIAGPSGGLCGTAAGFTRILQMMHPIGAGALPAGPRFTLDAVLSLGTRQLELVVDSKGNQKKPEWGLGCKYNVSKRSSGNGQIATVHELTKGGTLSSARASFFHIVIEKPWANPFSQGEDEVHSISIVVACTGPRVLTTSDAQSRVRNDALDIFFDGGWDNEVDLFPAMLLG